MVAKKLQMIDDNADVTKTFNDYQEETAFQLMYTSFVKTGEITLEKLVELMAINPRKRFGIPLNTDYTVWDLDKEYKIKAKDFLSKGKAMPFEDMTVNGKCVLTVCNGKVVYSE